MVTRQAFREPEIDRAARQRFLPTLMERSLDATQQLQEDSVELLAWPGWCRDRHPHDRDLNQRALRTTTPSGRRIGDRLQTPHPAPQYQVADAFLSHH